MMSTQRTRASGRPEWQERKLDGGALAPRAVAAQRECAEADGRPPPANFRRPLSPGEKSETAVNAGSLSQKLSALLPPGAQVAASGLQSTPTADDDAQRRERSTAVTAAARTDSDSVLAVPKEHTAGARICLTSSPDSLKKGHTANGRGGGGGGGGGGGDCRNHHVLAAAGRRSPSVEDGRSTLASSEDNHWRDQRADVPYYLQSRLDRSGIHNFESRDSINTDDCPTDASSMRRSMYSVDTVRCGTPYEGHLSVNAETPASDVPLCGEDKSIALAEALGRGAGTGCETTALINGKWTNTNGISQHLSHGPSNISPEYRVGSCWHCLINVPCPSLLTWLALCMATLGWSVSGYMTASLLKKMLQLAGMQQDWFSSPAVDEICIITTGVVTVCVGVFFLVVSTFSSENLSRYSFNTRAKNRSGRCINVVVLVLCYASVVTWSLICMSQMIPMTILGILRMTNDSCISRNIFEAFSLNVKSTTYDAESLKDHANEVLLTLTICTAFAFVVQMSMAAFLVNVSSNIRHLKETKYETYNTASCGPTNLKAATGELRDTAM